MKTDTQLLLEMAKNERELDAERDSLADQLAAAKEQAEKAEAERVKEWNRRRDTEDARDIAKQIAEELRMERDALAARLAELEGALECVPVDLINAIENGEKVRIFLSTESCKLIGAALASTPAQSLAKVQAEALSAMAKTICEGTEHPVALAVVHLIQTEADRLESEAANG